MKILLATLALLLVLMPACWAWRAPVPRLRHCDLTVDAGLVCDL